MNGDSASIRHESALLDISRAGAVNAWCASGRTNAGLSEEYSECMVGRRGGKGRREGVVKPCCKPFSMEKPFTAM